MSCQPASPTPASGDLSVELRTLTSSEAPAATAILAHGMQDNPLHVKVFGPNPAQRQRRLLRFVGQLVAYVHSNGEMLGAYAHDEMIGVLGMIRPGLCRPGLRGRVRFARAMLSSAPPTALLRIHRWLAAWARHDPIDPHWHIGPMAVRPAFRRRGVARRLMMECCQRMDALGATAWLETDLEINADFYRTLGFIVAREEPVLGVPTWFMRRAPICEAPLETRSRK